MLQDCPLESLRQLGEGFREPAISKKLGPKLLSYLQWQINFLRYKELCLARIIPKTTSQEFGILCTMLCRADYHLLCLPLLSDLTPFQDTVRLALLIIDTASLIGLPPGTTMAKVMAIQLRRAMLDSEVSTLWMTEQREVLEVLFWACFVGAHVSAGSKERPWFIVQLAKGAAKLGLKGKRDMLEVLLKFLYSERLCGDVCQMISGEVEEIREAIQNLGL